MQEEKETQNDSSAQEELYIPPSIIFESVISTRAGSPIVSGSPVPPADREAINLFPDD